MELQFGETQALKNGNWIPLNELGWTATDLGTTQGAMLVERLRTFGGRAVDVDDHLSRFADGAGKLGIPWPPRGLDMSQLVHQLLEHNRSFIADARDVGLVLLLSPGDPGIDRRWPLVPTVLGHLAPLPFRQLAQWYQHGADIHIASVCNVPPECWSPSIKTRSRLQYYLADHRLGAKPISDTPPARDSIAVLLNPRGFVTETSISNLLVLGRDGVLRSPPLDDILWGVSLKSVCSLAQELGLETEFVDLRAEDLQIASEVLMTGSTGCVWSAVSISGIPIGDGRPGAVCQQLQQRWQDRLGFRFVQQAFDSP